jgi:hypothetical protein
VFIPISSPALSLHDRGMVMPDDQSITFKNMIGLAVILAVNFSVASLLTMYHASVLHVCMACVGLLLVAILSIRW